MALINHSNKFLKAKWKSNILILSYSLLFCFLRSHFDEFVPNKFCWNFGLRQCFRSLGETMRIIFFFDALATILANECVDYLCGVRGFFENPNRYRHLQDLFHFSNFTNNLSIKSSDKILGSHSSLSFVGHQLIHFTHNFSTLSVPQIKPNANNFSLNVPMESWSSFLIAVLAIAILVTKESSHQKSKVASLVKRSDIVRRFNLIYTVITVETCD